MKTKVIHIVTSISDGGLEKVVLMIVSNLRNENIEHFVISLLKKDNVFFEKEFIDCGYIPEYFNYENRLNNLSSIFRFIRETFKLALYIKKNKINIIHSHDFFPAFSARITAIILFIFFFYKIDKIFITLHNQFFWLSATHHFINRILSLITTKIICVSESVMQYSKLNDKIPSSKYKIIYNGVERNRYVPDIKYKSIYQKEFGTETSIVIGNVGVLSLRKGHKYLIEAFNNIVNDYNVKLLIFGSERSHEKDIALEIYRMINNNGLSEKVKIIEPRKDLNLIYNLFDIFIMPSVSEGLSLSAVEAMLSKNICLFSDIGPFKEMITDGQNGFLFKSESSEDLTKKLKYILSKLDDLSNIRENARMTALNRYDVNRMCSEYESIYLI